MTREEFEEILAKEWQNYNERGARTVDSFEDNKMELAYSKGFYTAMKLCGKIDF